ncbi:InlB B-repeat-containing protein, partial [Candidatus Saccharibacteria bacterium]|nr:InlB B-repeat-containing protein [Candidatus Saccharibacteria bacterium]
MSRGTSGDIILKDGTNTSIRPTKDGTLGIGSDIVNVDTNCSAGYNIYLTAAENEGVDMILSSADTTSDIPISQKIVSSSTPIGSETTLEKNTWGVGKTASAFAGIQAYNTNTSTLTPFYHDTVTGGKDFTFYYGANITDEKTAGTYTIDVLYTAVTNTTCAEYTLSFDTSSATTVSTPSVYATRTISVDQKINLATLSSTSNISKTGYHITGWRNKKNTTETYGITGEVDVNPSDVINPTTSSDPTASAIILEPIWTANTYTIAYAAGNTGGTCSVTSTSATYDQNVTLSNTKCTKTGYTQDGWSTSSAVDNTKTYNMGATLTKPNFTSTNNGTYTLYPHFTIDQYTLTINPNGGTWNSSTSSSEIKQNYNTTYTVANPTTTDTWTISYDMQTTGITKPTSPTSVTKAFSGWTKAGTGDYNTSTRVWTFKAGDGSLTANWASSASFTLPTISKTGYT